MDGTATVRPRSRGILATCLLVAIVSSLLSGVLAGSATATSKGDSADITVVQDKETCEIIVMSSKDLSNVVVDSVDDGHVKFDRLKGKFIRLPHIPARGVWVKSGANASGAGPGYGEHTKLFPCIPGQGPFEHVDPMTTLS